MKNKVRLWGGSKVKMLTELVLSFISACIAFTIAYYGILTINLSLATKAFFKWLPYVFSYNKRLMALNKLARLDRDVTSSPEGLSGITRRWGILSKNDIGYREFLDIIKTEVSGSPDEIIYEQAEQPAAINAVTLQPRIELMTSLQAKTGDKMITIKGVDTYDPLKIMAELRESIKLKLWLAIAKNTLVGAFILLLLTLALAILKIIGVIK